MANAHPQSRPAARPSNDPSPLSRSSHLEGENGNGANHNDFHTRILRLREELGASEESSPHPEAARETEDTTSSDMVHSQHDLAEENERLRTQLEQARRRLEQFEKAAEQAKLREQEYESLLEEKSDLIRQLHLELQQKGGARSAAPVPNEDELIALHEELEREREQLNQDEEALMSQVREMEVQMSRERAEMARQRNELQRLQNELKHQLELAARDAQLRERLAPLYRLQEDIQRRRAAGK
jgi:DNA repair exonuclease SbcCD ATPase subunit